MADFRIGLIDSNQLVRSGRAMIFNSQPDMRVVLEESDPINAIERAPDYLVDVLLVGPSQHRIRGEQFIRTLSLALADAGNECVIVAYNSFTTSKNRYEAIRAGAQDFLGLDSYAADLLSLVRQTIKRDFIVDPVVLKQLGNEFGFLKTTSALEVRLSELDSAQTEIVTIFLGGLTDIAISKKLDMARTRVTGLIDGLVKAGNFTTRNQLALALLGGWR